MITDYDPDQIQKGQQFATKKYGAIPPEVEIRREDALALSFSGESFDLVISTLCFHHLEDHSRDFIRTPLALGEIQRVLKPRGCFLYWDMWNKKLVENLFLNAGFATLISRKHQAIYQKLMYTQP